MASTEFLFCKILQKSVVEEEIDLNSPDIVFEDTNIYVEHTDYEIEVPIVRKFGSNRDKIVTSVIT